MNNEELLNKLNSMYGKNIKGWKIRSRRAALAEALNRGLDPFKY
jgi:hypothetical protein